MRIILALSCSAAIFFPQERAEAAQEPVSRYSYFYKGKPVAMTPSPRYVVMTEGGSEFNAFIAARQLTRDPLGDRPPLQERNLRLYRIPPARPEVPRPIDLPAQLEALAQAPSGEVQPVFEQGGSLLIPSNEVIVAFKGSVDLNRAREILAPHLSSQGIETVRPHRRNTFVVTISDPSNGRAYPVCRFLSGLTQVEFAEPNHIVLTLDPVRRDDAPARVFRDLLDISRRGPAARDRGRAAVLDVAPLGALTSVGWVTLIVEDFDGGSLPAGWTTDRLNSTFADCKWSVTGHRSHSGARSVYATGGGAGGAAAPGPYPDNCTSWLATPSLDLTTFEEVYIEFWFYGKFGPNSSDSLYDLGAVFVHDMPSNTYMLAEPPYPFLWVGYTGDLTADPTTDGGWRRALFRVPVSMRSNNVKVEFFFTSDTGGSDEGLYVDQVRIVGTTDVDSSPIGNDTYGGRLYEMRNVGQIAGLGGDSNDMHVAEAWDLVTVSPVIRVAVLDYGVDLTHPDLNLVPGFDFDGTGDGHPREPHGTSVAGNVGARGNNSLGVMGTAPGVRIMPIFIGFTFVDNASAIDVAVSKGADIITNSWGWVGPPSPDIESAILDALAAGVVVLFAAGNGPDRPPFTYDVAFPGVLTGTSDVITVGASSPTDEYKGASSSDGSFLWGSSYVGPGPDVVAPSPWSYSTDIQGPGGYHDGSWLDSSDPTAADYMPYFGGTSSATPKVAGVVALMLSANPTLTPADVKRILRETADDIDVPGDDDKTGAGRVNAYRAVQRVTSGRPPAFSIHAGLANPYGSFGNLVDDGFTVNVDLFIPIRPNLGSDVRLGYSHFPAIASSGSGDADIWNLSFNLKYFPVPGVTWEPLFNGGPGLYYVDGDLEAGYNLGLGLGRSITPDVTFEVTYNFHSTVTASPNVRFGQLQGGFLFSF